MADDTTRFSTSKQRLNPWVIAGIALIHLALFYVLARGLAPNAIADAQDSVVSAFTVTVTAPEEELPVIDSETDEGAQGDPGEEAVPQPVTAPTPERRLAQVRPAPRASSTGAATISGASESGNGTGAAGDGEGTGAGSIGGGQGGIAVTKPILTRSISDSSAFPVPPGGREQRIGKSVIVRLSVSAQGTVIACSVYRPSPFPDTDARVCELSYEQIRFDPANDGQGNPVASTFYYQQRFFN